LFSLLLLSEDDEDDEQEYDTEELVDGVLCGTSGAGPVAVSPAGFSDSLVFREPVRRSWALRFSSVEKIKKLHSE
jgi:hypothetical protein